MATLHWFRERTLFRRRCQIELQFVPKDLWIGLYLDRHPLDARGCWYVYLCLVPMFVLRLSIREPDDLPKVHWSHYALYHNPAATASMAGRSRPTYLDDDATGITVFPVRLPKQ